MNKAHYGRLLLMAGLSFISMYVLMYAMVDTTANVYLNFSQAYMAGLMTAPMVIIELVLMRAMYHTTKLNVLINDSASRGRHSHVRTSPGSGRRDRGAVQEHPSEPAVRDRPDESQVA
jgi:hypothetical protein